MGEESVREHFPLPTVLKGVFSLLEQQFGLTFTLATENESSGVWSPEVSLYRVDENGKEVGHLYVDPCPLPTSSWLENHRCCHYQRLKSWSRRLEKLWYICLADVSGRKQVGLQVLNSMLSI